MTQRKSEKASRTEEMIQEALAGLASGVYATPYHAAKVLGLSRATLIRRINGGKTRAEAREPQQKLSKAEEKALEEWIVQLTMTGHPAKKEFIREMAEEIRNRRYAEIENASNVIPIPLSWVGQFMTRHPHLRILMARSIESARIKDIIVAVIQEWFMQFQATVEGNQITLENMYNMDETGKSS
jgi:hypothetical protein